MKTPKRPTTTRSVPGHGPALTNPAADRCAAADRDGSDRVVTDPARAASALDDADLSLPLRRLAEYRVDKADRGRGRGWLVLWLSLAPLLRSGLGGNRFRIAVLRCCGATIGSGCTIDRSFRVHYPWKLTLGEQVSIAGQVWAINPEPVVVGGGTAVGFGVVVCSGGHDHRSPVFTRTSEAVHIGAHCALGEHATVLKGVRLADRTVVPAGGLVVAGSRAAA